jgi:hypothetical protein
VTRNVAAKVDALSEENVALPFKPGSYEQVGGVTARDWISLQKAHPLWVNNTTGDGIIWIDNANRPVLDRDGKPIEVKFSDPAPAVAPPARYEPLPMGSGF